MKEIKSIIEHYLKIDFSTTRAALATVVRVEGSSYRRVGARMLVTEDGQWIGGISGGCLEGDALKRARLAMSTGKASMVTYDTTDDDPYQIGVGLGCNGIIDVLLSPLDPNDTHNAVLQLQPLVFRRQPSVVITVIDSVLDELPKGSVHRFESQENFEFPIARKEVMDCIHTCLTNEKSALQTLTGDFGSITLLLEIIPPPIHLFIHGGNYDIFPLVRQAKELGWLSTVFCNPQKINKSLFDWADHVVQKHTEIKPDDYTAVVLMAHDLETDFQNYQRYITATQVPYIGLLGPRKRFEKMIQRLDDEGITLSTEQFQRTYSPAGLDTGAATPEEIDLSILAEIRTVFSHREGGQLRKRKTPIYSEES
ncbi:MULTISPECIES: XdhC family protein [unclassified Siphonobacter]|uniref:XdhC family protein n=1 Tax=unclassified Siphonobacter TaxID=2635712 RepID=UPI002789B9CB|nr:MULTISPECIES: XdhC family protein [unclassified Siphonobacter]MDQ1088251.1 xanthine dehydrogenase accessory factor [Siphonobacter sp. SORGH_AS_1065]MDR6194397.1 xanthine dehydrogenase accessory factor [Siphonobacter sp. SORGH_AS_0500]